MKLFEFLNRSLSTPVTHILLVELWQTIGIVLLHIGHFSILFGESSDTRKITSFIFVVTTQGSLTLLLMNEEFPSHRRLQERIIYESIQILLLPTLYTVLIYPLSGYQLTLTKFFLFLLTLCLHRACTIALVDFVRKISKLVSVSPFVPAFAAIDLVRIVSLTGIPVGGGVARWFSWLGVFDHVRHTLIVLVLNELQGLSLTCDPTTQFLCSSGNELLQQYPQYQPDSIWNHLITLTIATIVLRIMNSGN